jgi:hypothetical protein
MSLRSGGRQTRNEFEIANATPDGSLSCGSLEASSDAGQNLNAIIDIMKLSIEHGVGTETTKAQRSAQSRLQQNHFRYE